MGARGIMFHHFHDRQHPAGQGAISAEDLRDMIKFLGRENILGAHEFAERAQAGKLKDGDLCLTFDDALLCQYDVARPVLADFNLTAFWFIYSSVFQGGVETLEVYRYFRTVAFDDIDDFYEAFFKRQDFSQALAGFDPDRYLADDPFYTRNDRIFRYLRDRVLGPENYRKLMDAMIADAGFSVDAIKHALWMTDDHLRELAGSGHVIGLHSFRHPTVLAELPVEVQREEYTRNFDHLVDTIGSAPWAVSHPCNSYVPATLDILRDLNIKLGFRAYVNGSNGSLLELPREDHALVMGRMRA